jgi:hypothetical protein
MLTDEGNDRGKAQALSLLNFEDFFGSMDEGIPVDSLHY